MGFDKLIYLWTAIFPLTVLLYYFFRKKYTNQPVSSTLFWQEVMKETKASPYLQHLQRNALFYLQMLALLLFVFALLQPFWKTKAIAGEQIIWIVDTSASMLAEKDGKSVFDLHIEEMNGLSDQLAGKPLTLLTTGEEPKVVLRDETNINEVQKAIQSLEVSYENEQLPKVLDFAQTLLADKATTIYLFTDSVDRMDIPQDNVGVNYIVKGAPTGLLNVSINRFGATKTESGTSAIIQLSNDTKAETTGTVSIKDMNTTELVNEKFTIPAEDSLTLSFKDLPSVDALSASLDVNDHYSLDNEMSILLQQNVTKVMVDGSLHQLIKSAFEAMDFPVSSVPSEQLKNITEPAVIVTNQTSYLSELEQPVLLIGRNDEIAKEAVGEVKVQENSLFSFADLSNVYVNGVYPPFEGFETIAYIGNDPFIQKSPDGDIVILSDIQMTDWPLHPSFPLFLWSAREELSVGGQYIGTFSPNERRPLALVNRTNAESEWEIYSLSGEYDSSISNGGEFQAPAKPGLYMLKSNTEEKHFSVLLQQSEKELLPGTSFQMGQIGTDSIEETVNESIVPWIILIVALLLLAEWEVQRRRGFAN